MAAPGANRIVIVVTGGAALDAQLVADLPADAMVVAADSGIDRALDLGLHVDVAVGDFDSVSTEGLETVADRGAQIQRHRTAKDETDLELALDTAVALGASRVLVLGGDGGRLDHLLGNVLVLTAAKYAALDLVAEMATARVTVVRARAVLSGQPNDLVTLLAVGGPAFGVTTTGLQYPLRDEDLHPGSSRGVSNVLVDDHAEVLLRSGTLVAVQPRPIGTEP